MIDCAAASYALSQIRKREKVPTEMGGSTVGVRGDD